MVWRGSSGLWRARFCQRHRDPLRRLLRLGAVVASVIPWPLALAAVVLVLAVLPVLAPLLLPVLALLLCGLRPKQRRVELHMHPASEKYSDGLDEHSPSVQR